MNSSSSVSKSSYIGSIYDKKSSSKSLGPEMNVKPLLSKSQFINYKHNSKKMKETQRNQLDFSVYIDMDDDSDDICTKNKENDSELDGHISSYTDIRIIY